jgi:HEAT repeat protein
LAILADFHSSREDVLPPAAIGAALDSDRWQKRVAGLQAIGGHRFDIMASPGYVKLLNSPYPQERYWLAHALGASPNPQAFADLIRLLDDPQINVRTMALEGLAQRRDPRAVNPILRLLKTSHEWYDQLYAYQALRTLRWNQTRLH